jgi:hypothetical protein
LLRQLRSNDSLWVHIEVLVDTLSVHVETLRVSVKTGPLEITPIDSIPVQRLRLATDLLILTVQTIGTKSRLPLPAEVGVHIQSVEATKARERPLARSSLEDEKVLDNLSIGAFAWEVLGVASLLPGGAVV